MPIKKILEPFLKQVNQKVDIEHCINAFELYLQELIRWNKIINLTAIEDESEIVIKHFIDSLIPITFINDNDFILDIGSGAGFPGLPIKIVKPSVRLVMIDSRLKKINFINNIINLLNIHGATALHQRAEAEDFQKVMKESFDVVISRASFSIEELAELSKPYLKNRGKLIAMKSKKIEDVKEMNGFKQTEELKTHLPDGSFRRIIVFERIE
ncbi:MAG: 16S rRNA (guanine(527)-N(7))-methyltransferase RsmG [bacterium]